MNRYTIAAVTLLATGCGAKSVTVPSNDNGTPIAVSAAADVTSGAAPLSVNFHGSAAGGSGPISLTWDFGDGMTQTGADASHVYGAQGDFVATLTATDKVRQASATITIHAGAVPATPDLVVDSVELTPVKTDDRFEPNDTADYYVGGRGYIWTIDDATIAPTSVDVHAVVRNAGGQAISSPFDVDLYSSLPTPGARGDDGWRLQTLAAGEKTDVWFTLYDVAAGSHDAWVGADAGGEIAEANETNDVSAKHSVTVADDVDLFSVYEVAGQTITVDLSSLPADYDVALYDDFGNQLASSLNASTTAEHLTYAVTSSGFYVVKVWGAFGAASSSPYHLAITVP